MARTAAAAERTGRPPAPGGALVFNVPAAYLGQPDGPGGGGDPLLTGLHAALLQHHPGPPPCLPATATAAARTAAAVDAGLREAGLQPTAWQHHQRLTQAAWCDWMKLPMLTAALWPGTVCRIAAPDRLVPATPPHRDADYLGDSAGVWGAWIALTDCGIADGVLAIAPDSQHGDDGPGYAAADLRVADVLLLSARTRHRACPNLRPQRVRLSVDLRFGPAG